MAKANVWPVRVVALGPVAVGTTLWRYERQLNVTLMVKATFQFCADGPMTLVSPEPLLTEDHHLRDQALYSLTGVEETVPQLQQPEVVFYGCAYAPPGCDQGVTQSTVRLVLSRDDHSLIDKQLVVYGNREPGGQSEPFQRLRLGYKCALGGIGFEENPIGLGLGGSDHQLPNVVSATDPTGEVVGFSPIPATFPSRKRRLGKLPSIALEQRIVDLPPDFDWSYFQAAPPDQRLGSLRGDEWLQLEGVTAGRRTLRTRLPGLNAVSRVYGHQTAGAPDYVPLVLDLLTINAERGVCWLVWRGSFPIIDEAALSSLTIAATIHRPGKGICWPATADGLVPVRDPSLPRVHTILMGEQTGEQDDTTVTMELEPVDETTQLMKQTLAGQPPSSFEQHRFRPTAAASNPTEDGETTGGSTSEGTQRLDADQLKRMAADSAGPPMPFGAARAQSSVEDTQQGYQAFPGAPWSAQPVEPVCEPYGEQDQTADVVARGLGTVLADNAASTQDGTTPGVDPEHVASTPAQDVAVAADNAAAEKAAADKAAAEAEARRRLEAKQFAEEQAQAKIKQQRWEAERRESKLQAARKLREHIYGGFKRKRKG